MGLILFIIYINDIPDMVEGDIETFVDDIKMFKAIEGTEDCEAPQEDLNKLQGWCRTWQLVFNAVKCKVKCLGCTKPGFEYVMVDQSGSPVPLEESKCKDLGMYVYVGQKMTFNRQVYETIASAQQTTWNHSSGIPLPGPRNAALLVQRAG